MESLKIKSINEFFENVFLVQFIIYRHHYVHICRRNSQKVIIPSYLQITDKIKHFL